MTDVGSIWWNWKIYFHQYFIRILNKKICSWVYYDLKRSSHKKIAVLNYIILNYFNVQFSFRLYKLNLTNFKDILFARKVIFLHNLLASISNLCRSFAKSWKCRHSLTSFFAKHNTMVKKNIFFVCKINWHTFWGVRVDM